MAILSLTVMTMMNYLESQDFRMQCKISRRKELFSLGCYMSKSGVKYLSGILIAVPSNDIIEIKINS